MGAQESKEKESQLLNIFTLDERHNIQKLYSHITANQKALTEPFLKKYLPKWLDERLQFFLYGIMRRTSGNQDVSEIMFGEFLAQALKGTYSDKTYILIRSSYMASNRVEVYQLYLTVKSILTTYVNLTETDNNRKTWKSGCTERDVERLSLHLLALTEVPIEGDQNVRTTDELEIWMSKCPLFVKIFDTVFNQLFPVLTKETNASLTKSLIPVAQNVDWSRTSTVLDYLSISYINFHLPVEQQSPWRLLYSNSAHGDSFAQLVRYVSGKGANVLVVRDKEGHVFGAYVSESWEMRSNFFGTSDCFLFTIQPSFGVYTSTGYNENFMYFNQGQETLPNGLGLGGQLDYFGLWIDHSFNSGHSQAKPKCTTFGSPQLSGSPEFVVDTIEVWALGCEKKTTDSDDDEYAQTSILDKDMGAKAILEMAGKKQHSDGLRELEEDEPLGTMTDEMKRKMNTIPSMF